ncbi:MAG: RNA ligase family protein [Cyanobacteria bacterium]|nr:RNA ligase family protein [Cyanobacteriota bacterium]
MSPEERRALKLVAVQSDTSVAELLRALASGLSSGVIAPEELLTQVRKGAAAMEKIPTIFDRGSDFRVVNSVRKGCEWVFAGEGDATEKLDGMNIRLTIRTGKLVRVEKRRNPSKVQKAQGIIDGWYIDADEYGAEDKWLFEAARGTNLATWPDGEHPCEALGPNIQGNPLKLEHHLCVPFNLEIPKFNHLKRDYESLREELARLESLYSPGNLVEGIVFHHPDGRRAKIKRKDFPKRT